MPYIPGYQPNQVSSASITDARFRAADNNGGVGAAIGQGLQQLGQAVGQFAQVQDQVDTLHAEAAAKEADNQVVTAQATLGYDGPAAFFNLTGAAALTGRETYEKGVNDAVTNARATLGSSPLAQRLFDETIAARKPDMLRAVGQHVEQQTKAYAVDTSSSRAGLAFESAVQTALSAEQSNKQIETGRAEIVNLGHALGWAPERIQYEQMTRVASARQDVLNTILTTGGVTPASVAAAHAYLDTYQGDFTGDKLVAARTTIIGAERSQLAAQAREAAIAKAQFTEQVATVKADAARGIDVSARLPDLIRGAEAFGDKSGASDMRGLLGDQVFTKTYQQSTPIERQQRVSQLAALKHPSEPEQQELKWLRDHGGALDSHFDSDPAGYMASTGHAPPPIGPARAQWAASMSRATGRPVPPLTKEEATQYRSIAVNGSEGQDKVLRDLDRLPAGGARADAAKQIAPEDAVFQHMAQINPLSRPVVRAGAQMLKDKKNYLNPDNDPRIKQALGAVDAQLRLAWKEFEPRDQNAVSTVAVQYLAGKVSHGDWHMTSDNAQSLASMAVRVALGGYSGHGQQLGGLGDWNGHPVALPDGSTNASFANGVRVHLGKHVPTNRDGSTIAIASIIPVMIGPNTYRFEGPDGRVVSDKARKPIVMTLHGAYR